MAVWRRLFRFAVCNLYQDQQSIRTNCGIRGRKVKSGLPMSGNLEQITPYRASIRRGVMTKPAETVPLMQTMLLGTQLVEELRNHPVAEVRDLATRNDPHAVFAHTNRVMAKQPLY